MNCLSYPLWRCFFIILIVLLRATFAPSAQENHCDPQLTPPKDDPYGYRLRGDRCEGEYMRPVGSTTLLIASLTESVENFNPVANRDLVVEWTAPGAVSVHLRAQALRHRLYYRMDTIRPSGSASFRWTPNLLATFKLNRDELGTVAWTSYRVGDANRDVYIPLRISQHGAAIRSRSYELKLLPGVELDEVYYSLAPVKPEGRTGTFVKKDQPVGSGYYPAGRAFVIKVPELRASGIYYLKIGATRKSGGATTAEIWFYSSGG
jgi:hypothetical protein